MRGRIVRLIILALALGGWATPALAQDFTFGGGLRAQGDNVQGYWGTASLAPSSRSCLSGTVHVTGSRWADPEQERAVLAGVTCSANSHSRVRPFVQGLVGASNDPRVGFEGLLARVDWRVGVDVRVDSATWVRTASGVRSLMQSDIGPGLTWSVGLVRTFNLWD